MRRKHPVLEFNNIRYYRKPSGYYKADYVAHGRTRYMHRDVWEFHHGPIPAGYCVHHRDHDRSNNAVDNLELLTTREHAGLHCTLRTQSGTFGTAETLAMAQEAAKQWHASDAGRAWHAEHARKVWETRPEETRACAHCGKPYTGVKGAARVGLCSPACVSAARRASGADNEERRCTVCGSAFVVNRYARTKTCGTACWKAALSAAKSRVCPDGG